ncbi:helix-turn-helix domain-containing protein [Nocardia sp. NPDC004722]
MGTREDLLAAAKQCLATRGYARTTVRDIVAASGANLAAINYHLPGSAHRPWRIPRGR